MSAPSIRQDHGLQLEWLLELDQGPEDGYGGGCKEEEHLGTHFERWSRQKNECIGWFRVFSNGKRLFDEGFA